MKTLSLMTYILLSIVTFGQSVNLDGAYLAKSGHTNSLLLFKNGYCSKIIFEDNKYISTQGGPYAFDGQSLQITWEYNDANPESVGSKTTIPSILSGTSITIEGQDFIKQMAKVQDLDAVWRITGRQNAENVITDIPRRDRKTIKILVDGYFQWIAINPAEKGFYGTGGGEYSFLGDQYVEKILFFSRDNSRVGNTLNFKGALKDGAWHHSGLSSKGEPIYEIWSLE